MKQERLQTVAQRIAEALRRHGVEVIFGQSLPSAVILACEAIGIRQLAYRQENMGGAMAAHETTTNATAAPTQHHADRASVNKATEPRSRWPHVGHAQE